MLKPRWFVARAVLAASLLGAWQGAAVAQPARTDVPAHRPDVPGVHGLVTSGGQPLAAMAGVRTLMAGGNAADAAVAVMAALNVVQPEMTGAGGNGFVTYFEKSTGKVYSLHMAGHTPLATRPADITPELLNAGYKAGTTPGQFGGWVELLDRFGTKSLAEVFAPAVSYAIDGHPIDAKVVRSIENRKDLADYPTSARVFLPGGRAPKPGETFKQTDLGRTFQRLVEAEQGALRQGKSRSEALRAAHDRFYTGDIAQEIAAFYRENGGLLSLEDLKQYRPQWNEPLHTTYRGYDVYSTGSTSRGGYEVTMQLNLIEGFDVAKIARNRADLVHLLAEAITVAKSDIYRYVADPKFTKIPTNGMLSKEYAASRRPLIDMSRALGAVPEPGEPGKLTLDDYRPPLALGPSPDRPQFPERSWDGSTTTLSVVDQAGNVAVITPTLGSLFGTGVVIGSTGLFLNNGGRVGSTAPYPDNVNYPRGGQIPILNNSPTVVLKDGKFVMSVGSAGGETIGQTEFQVLVNVLDLGMSVQEAVEAPRIAVVADPNFYKPGAKAVIRIENRHGQQVMDALRALGHELDVTEPYNIGNLQAVVANPAAGTVHAGADPRSSGYAIGF